MRLKKDQKKTKSEAKRLLRLPFMLAQLTYYDIKVPPGVTEAEANEHLRNAVQLGLVSGRAPLRDVQSANTKPRQCDGIPDSIVALEAAMREDYIPMHRQWQADVKTWEIEQDRLRGEAFAKCTTPSEQAACDPQRFVDVYFLTDGRPDHTKTPKPIVLHGSPMIWPFLDGPRSIPSLHHRRVGEWHNQKSCVGWDLGEVHDVVNDLREQQRREEAEKTESLWRNSLAEHRAFVSSRGGRGAGRPFGVEAIGGFYVVECKMLRDSFPPDEKKQSRTVDSRPYPRVECSPG